VLRHNARQDQKRKNSAIKQQLSVGGLHNFQQETPASVRNLDTFAVATFRLQLMPDQIAMDQ
jgi:hypothetical protein